MKTGKITTIALFISLSLIVILLVGSNVSVVHSSDVTVNFRDENIGANLKQTLVDEINKLFGTFITTNNLYLVYFDLQEDWAFISFFDADDPNPEVLEDGEPELSYRFVAHKNATGVWEAGLAGTAKYSDILWSAPNWFIADSAKPALDPLYQTNQPSQTTEQETYRLPWDVSQNKWYRLRESPWHGDGDNALDFQPTWAEDSKRTAWALAVARGTITDVKKCDTTGMVFIKNGDGITQYLHLEKDSIRVRIGDPPVVIGQWLGNLYYPPTNGDFDDGDCGNGTGRILHVTLPSRDIIIDGETWQKYGDMAYLTKVSSSNQKVDGNDELPLVSFNQANNTAVSHNSQNFYSNNPNWTFSGTASDDNGIAYVNYTSWGNNGRITKRASGTTNWRRSINGLIGHNRVHFLAYDTNGQRNPGSDKYFIDLYVDIEKPVTNASVNGVQGDNGWYTSDVNITLVAQDIGSGGSGSRGNIPNRYTAGIKIVRYRVDSGNWQTYSGIPFSVTGDGAHTIEYYAKDKVGNQETTKTITINIDTTPPSAPANIVEANGAISGQWQNSWNDAAFNWDAASDNQSGIHYYRIDWGGEQAVTANTAFNPAPVRTGSYTLTVRAVDNAGNIGLASDPFYFNHDGTPPPPPEIFHTEGVASGVWQNAIRTADFYWPTPNDDGSGINGYYLYWGPDENGTNAVLITANSYVDATPITDIGNAVTYYLRLKSEDNVGQQSPWISFALRYDNANPVGQLVANYGQETVPQTLVHLDIDGTDLGSGVAAMRLSTEGYIWSEWRDLEQETFWEIPNVGRRSYDIYLQLLDGANNLSEPISDTVFLDTSVLYPRSDNFQLWNNLVSGGSAEGMQTTSFQMDATVGQGYDAPYLLSSQYILQPGYRAAILSTPTVVPTSTGKILLGSVVSAGGTDAAALNSPQYRMYGTLGQPSDTQVVTSTNFVATLGFWGGAGVDVSLQPPPPPPPPTPQPCEFYSLSINEGALFTNDPNVSLGLCGPGAEWMMLSNDGGFGGASWQNFTSAVPGWTLTTYGNTILPRYVYARYQDSDGNIYGNFFDDIIYDPTAPSGVAAFDPGQLLGGQRLAQLSMLMVNQTNTELFLSVSDDNSGLDEMQVSLSPNFDGAAWQDYTGIVPVTFTKDGVQTVYTRFRDKAGNISPAIGDQLMVDTTAPTGSVVVNNPIVGYGDISVSLSLSAQDATSGAAYMRVSHSSSFTDTIWITYTGSAALPIPSGTITPTVYVQYRDRAGNESDIIETSYQIDDTRPDGWVEVTAWQETTATLSLSANDSLSAITEVWISPDFWFLENVSVVPYAATLEWDFGEYGEMFFMFKDAAGNYSYPLWTPGTSTPVVPPDGNTIYLPMITK